MFLQGLGAALAQPAAFAASPPGAAEIRIGLTPVFLDDQVSFLNAWLDYLRERLERPVRFIQRGSYREITDLLLGQKLDFAWICGYPYVQQRKRLRLMAIPVFEGRPFYRSYLIVPAVDAATQSILDLRGKVFAYSDPDSNSGFLYPNYRLIQLNERPDAFFSKPFFTWAHRKVVEAVAARLADGGAVDGYVWETLAKFNPELTVRTRVVEMSPEFAHTPFVAQPAVPKSDFVAMRRVLLEMNDNAAGRALLKQLNLDGFVGGSDGMFDGIAQMARTVNRYANAPAA